MSFSWLKTAITHSELWSGAARGLLNKILLVISPYLKSEAIWNICQKYRPNTICHQGKIILPFYLSSITKIFAHVLHGSSTSLSSLCQTGFTDWLTDTAKSWLTLALVRASWKANSVKWTLNIFKSPKKILPCWPGVKNKPTLKQATHWYSLSSYPLPCFSMSYQSNCVFL